ncbi:radical SAM protein [Candidatus Sumerlaeota bacterium]|nr:radical SAM protein [Candidatus Sumerlaeota bacterium]
MQNLGICHKCNQVVPARHETREGRVYLVKDCTECGATEALVSSDARRWQEKRDICGYDEEKAASCSLACTNCNHGKAPSLVFLDVTNRCNMNCPICLANVQAMGFRFDPPMAYFEKVFETLGRMKPRPKIQLFGGEPTVRNDLIDIVKLAKKHGLSARVVTNGIRLADEDYCKRLLATGTQLMFAFDGRDPEIYRKIRNSAASLDKKLAALENVRKHRRSKVTIMCCAGLGVNDDKMDDMIRFCHDGRDYIAALDLIPLVETWGPEGVDAGNTTIDDVERMIRDALPGVDFIPAGLLYQLENLQKTFNVGRLTFGGAHPNCESATALVSDGKAYRPASHYLKGSLTDAVRAAAALDLAMGKKFKTSVVARLFGRKGRQLVMGAALLGLVRRHVNFREVFGSNAAFKTVRVLWGLARGEKMKHLLRRHTQCHGILRIIVLPFEEPMNIESVRLVECPASFAYEHPETNDIRLMPVCAWPYNKDDILRATTQRYGVQTSESVAAPQSS